MSEVPCTARAIPTPLLRHSLVKDAHLATVLVSMKVSLHGYLTYNKTQPRRTLP